MSLTVSRRLALGVAVLVSTIGHGMLLTMDATHGITGQPLRTNVHPMLWLASLSTAKTASAPPVRFATKLMPDSPMHVKEGTRPDSVFADPALYDLETIVATDVPTPKVQSALAAHVPAVTADELTHYHPANELSARARITSTIDLDLKAASSGVERGGRARLVVLVSENGTVDRVAVESSTLDQSFLTFALSQFYGAHFQPGEIHGVPVPARSIIEISDMPSQILGK